MNKKNTNTPQPRQPKGSREGGRFTTKQHGETPLDLEDNYLPYDNPNPNPDPDLLNPFPQPGQPAPDYLLARYSPDYNTWSEVLADVARETNRNTAQFRASANQDFREQVTQETLSELAKRFRDAIDGIEAGNQKTAPTQQPDETKENYDQRWEAWRRDRIRHVAQQTKHTLIASKIKGNAIRVDIQRETGKTGKLSGAQITGRKMLIERIDQYQNQHGHRPSTAEKQAMWAEIRAENSDSFRRHTGIDDWAVSGLIYNMRNITSLDTQLSADDDTHTLADTITSTIHPGLTPAQTREQAAAQLLPSTGTQYTIPELEKLKQHYIDEIGLHLHEQKLAGFRAALAEHATQVIVDYPTPGSTPKTVAQQALDTIRNIDDLEQAITDCARHRDTDQARALMCMWRPPTGNPNPDSIYETDQNYAIQEQAWGQTSVFFAWMQHQPVNLHAPLPINEANPTPYDLEECLRFWRTRIAINTGSVQDGWENRFMHSLPGVLPANIEKQLAPA